MRPLLGPLASALVAAILAGCGGGEDGAADDLDGGRFDTERAMEDLRAQVDFGPRPAGSAANRRQARFLADRLREAGLEDVRIQRPHRNVVGTIPGHGEGAIVLGAHHDTVEIADLVGANDGASGVAVVLELARSLPAPLEGPEIRVALFDAEEARPDRDFASDGTQGSRQYVSYSQRARKRDRLGSAPLAELRAMVLFDMVGDCDLQIPLEANSDPDLHEAFAAASRELDGTAAPFAGERGPVADDHLPFIESGVPAVDLIDFTYGPGGSPGGWWHTPEDTLDKVCPESLDAVGEAAVEAIPKLP